MGTIFLVIPLLLILVTLAYGVAQVLVRAWLDYRVRIAFLEKLEKNPAMVGPQADVPAIMSSIAATSFAYQRQNYALTGLLLTGFGIIFLAVGRLMRSGELAVGIFFGGVFCVLLGLVIALFGFIIRVMTRTNSPRAASSSSNAS